MLTTTSNMSSLSGNIQSKYGPVGDKYEAVSSDDSYRVYMRLKIRSVALADFGAYKCVAKNSLGETDGTIKLYEIPNPHTTFSVTTTTIGRQTSTETAIRHAKKKGSTNHKF